MRLSDSLGDGMDGRNSSNQVNDTRHRRFTAAMLGLVARRAICGNQARALTSSQAQMNRARL